MWLPLCCVVVTQYISVIMSPRCEDTRSSAAPAKKTADLLIIMTQMLSTVFALLMTLLWLNDATDGRAYGRHQRLQLSFWEMLGLRRKIREKIRQNACKSRVRIMTLLPCATLLNFISCTNEMTVSLSRSELFVLLVYCVFVWMRV